MSDIVAMISNMTVLDLARAIAPVVSYPLEPTKDHIELAHRRIRNWTLSGALRTAGNPNVKSGNHRRYDESSLYVASVLSVFADKGQSIGVLLIISGLIRSLHGDDPLISGFMHECWTKAIDGTSPIFLLIGDYGPVDPAVSVEEGRKTLQMLIPHSDLQQEILLWRAGAFANLTDIFKQIAFPCS